MSRSYDNDVMNRILVSDLPVRRQRRSSLPAIVPSSSIVVPSSSSISSSSVPSQPKQRGRKKSSNIVSVPIAPPVVSSSSSVVQQQNALPRSNSRKRGSVINSSSLPLQQQQQKKSKKSSSSSSLGINPTSSSIPSSVVENDQHEDESDEEVIDVSSHPQQSLSSSSSISSSITNSNNSNISSHHLPLSQQHELASSSPSTFMYNHPSFTSHLPLSTPLTSSSYSNTIHSNMVSGTIRPFKGDLLFNGEDGKFPSFKKSIENSLLTQSDNCYQELLPPAPAYVTNINNNNSAGYSLPPPPPSSSSSGSSLYRLPEPNPYDHTEVNDTLRFYQSTPQRRARVLLFISSSISHLVSGAYSSFNTPEVPYSPYRYWSALCSRYAPITAAQKRSVEQKLQSECLRSNDKTIDEWVGRLLVLFNSMSSFGELVSEERQMRLLLGGLPPIYSGIVEIIDNMRPPISFDEAVRRIKEKFSTLQELGQKNDRGGEERSRERRALNVNAADYDVGYPSSSSSFSSSSFNPYATHDTPSSSSTHHQHNNHHGAGITQQPRSELADAMAMLARTLSSSFHSNRGGRPIHHGSNRGGISTSSSRPWSIPCKWCHQSNPTHRHRECQRAPTCPICHIKGHHAENCRRTNNNTTTNNNNNGHHNNIGGFNKTKNESN